MARVQEHHSLKKSAVSEEVKRVELATLRLEDSPQSLEPNLP